ncbi:MAG: outer membrane beta-barrel protein [Deltaproteobacteria bacterium]|nr:outer membrane beta-barrel protein [Deltaproteobacteria bacterium]
MVAVSAILGAMGHGADGFEFEPNQQRRGLSSAARLRGRGASEWTLGVAFVVGLITTGITAPAYAQYRSFTFGAEVGYIGMTSGTELKPHNFAFGMLGGYKSSDHWWFTARAMASFPGQLDNAPNTVVVLQIEPISVRYYFETDSLRPWFGLSNAFQLLFNHTTHNDAMWGPGVAGGLEIKLKRDLFLGFEADFYHLLIFEGPDAQLVQANAQLIFFL